MAKISRELDQRIRQQAKHRCGYCLNPQELIPYKLEIEHIHPKALGGETVEENLWLACRECNAHKARKVLAVDPLTEKTVKLFNPRKQNWYDHFEFSPGKTEIIGKTACGRATVESLQMNNIFQKTPVRLGLKLESFRQKIEFEKHEQEFTAQAPRQNFQGWTRKREKLYVVTHSL